MYSTTWLDVLEQWGDIFISIKSIKLVCVTNNVDCLMHEAVNEEKDILCNSIIAVIIYFKIDGTSRHCFN